MKADAVTLLGIFEKKMRLEVPLFQRQYVWSREHQWEALWEDIARKFIDQMEGRQDAPVHFLGAMVLDQKQTPTTHVEKRQVIDGQQRLTTLQLFVAAFRDFCTEHECLDVASELQGFVFNKGMMVDPDVEKFKVWPTQADRQQFTDVISSGSRKELEKRYPLVKRKYARSFDPRPRMVEAYLFFRDQMDELFIGTDKEVALEAERPLAERVELSFTALKSLLKVVVIDLETGDDAQVIFETLNARGEPLLPADLLRNFIFLRAARSNEPQEKLYDKYWRKFDDPFWRDEVKQGRLLRPRSDLYIQHFLASKLTVDIPIKHLFVEYKSWINGKAPYPSVEAELSALSRQGDQFRRIVEPQKDDIIYPLVTFLDNFDIRTAYPLLLHLLEEGLSDADWQEISIALESYLLRRAVCGLTTKNYNRVFLGLTRTLRKDGTSADRIYQALSDFGGDSNEWPRDEAFRASWNTGGAYQVLQSGRLVHLFRRLNEKYLNTKSEAISIDSPLTVEHLMPQGWIENWPLPNGALGLTYAQLEDAAPDDAAAIATRRRNSLIHSIGNMTIVSQALNSSVSNSDWATKKPEILKSSLLPINLQLVDKEKWNEATIVDRSADLFKFALGIWPGPKPSSSEKG
jgi:uncharacterized protein with ParB-like and HNH nuclease domain